MRILIISPGVVPVPAIKGGAVENLIEMLITSKEITKQHEITVYSVYDEELNEKIRNINCNFKFIYSNKKLYFIKKVIRHIINRVSPMYIGNQFIHSVAKDIKENKEEYDIIIVENEPQYGKIIKKVKGKAKLILHLHNDYLNVDTKNASEMKENYDFIYCISKYIKQRVDEISINDKQKGKSKVLYNGVDIKKFNPTKYNKKELRKEYGFNENDFIFMYSGRLVPEKGVKEMIQAFCKVEDNKCKLLILGKGKEEFTKELKEVAKPKIDKIIFKGYMDYEKLPQIYNIADIGVVPSICNEAFGLTVIEFLASGIPIIISDKGAMQEIVNKTGENAYIAKKDKNYIENIKEAMDRYIHIEANEIKQMKINAVNNAKRFTKEIYSKRFLELLEEVEIEENK